MRSRWKGDTSEEESTVPWMSRPEPMMMEAFESDIRKTVGVRE
jgi:hypothetical protein